MDKWVDWIRVLVAMPKRYKGAALGFIVWVLLEWIGFFQTLLLVVLMVIGYGIGRFADGREKWLEVIARMWHTDRFDP